MAFDEDRMVHLLVRSFFTPKSLEDSTKKFEGRFCVSNLRDLPEYQGVVDALRVYGDAVASYYLEEVKRRSRGK